MPEATGNSETGEDASSSRDPGGRTLDVRAIGGSGAIVAWLAALASGTGAVLLAGAGGRTALTGGILLGVVTLAALAVGVQATGEPWPGEPGYAEERRSGRDGEGGAAAVGETKRHLPLADRLALGLLGGALGGIAVTAAVWAVDAAAVSELLGIRISGTVTATALALRTWYGALWGVVLGVLFPRLPGRSATARGVLFGLVPALYALLVLYPLVLDLGWFGADLGVLTFVLVVPFHLLWGSVVGGLFQWGEETELEVLSRPLVGP